jgi:hypothetical protein
LELVQRTAYLAQLVALADALVWEIAEHADAESRLKANKDLL